MSTERSLTDQPAPARGGDDEPEVGLTDQVPDPDDGAIGTGDEPEDITVLPEPEDYDFSAMVAGVKPSRARVRIRPRSDLKPLLEELAEWFSSMEGQDVPADVLAEREAEWDEVKAAYDQTFVVVVEGRTSDWVRELWRSLKNRGIDPGRKGLSPSAKAEHERRRVNAQIAAQIVHPTQGVTEAAIAALAEANEPEVSKIYAAVTQVNTRPAVDATFLRGR